MNMVKPKRPSMYWIVHVLSFGLIILVCIGINFLSKKYIPEAYQFFSCLPILLFYTFFVSPMIYRNYKDSKEKYCEAVKSQKEKNKFDVEQNEISESNVNQSISDYLKEKNRIKESAKWWQIWL